MTALAPRDVPHSSLSDGMEHSTQHSALICMDYFNGCLEKQTSPFYVYASSVLSCAVFWSMNTLRRMESTYFRRPPS